MNELDELLAGVEPTAGQEGLIAEAVLETLSEEGDGLEELVATDGFTAPEIDKNAIYAAQESRIGVGSEDDAAPVITEKANKKAKKDAAPAEADAEPAKGKGKGKAKAKKADAAVAPEKEEKTVTAADKPTTKSGALARRHNVDDLTKLGIEAGDIPGILAGMDSAPKKVGEKAYNMLRFALGREHLSNYTRFTLEQLSDKDLTVPQLVKLMEERGYKPGTARSQSQQMSRLFGIFGMVDRSAGTMRLDKKHPLVKEALARLRKMRKDAENQPQAA